MEAASSETENHCAAAELVCDIRAGVKSLLLAVNLDKADKGGEWCSGGRLMEGEIVRQRQE